MFIIPRATDNFGKSEIDRITFDHIIFKIVLLLQTKLGQLTLLWLLNAVKIIYSLQSDDFTKTK